MSNPYIRAIRCFRGMSREEMAKELEIPARTLWKIETGRKDPEIGLLRRMAQVLSVDVNVLIAERVEIRFIPRIEEAG